MLRPRSWIHRRVETVNYLDRSMAQRHVSIDFDVPTVSRRLGLLYVPIAQFAKRKLTHFTGIVGHRR
jgi:hypothetical protein